MKIEQYLEQSSRTAKSLGNTFENITHYIFGMVGEYFSEVFLPETFENKDKLLEEYGDFMWYFAGYCRERGITLKNPTSKNTIATPTLIGMIAEHEKKVFAYGKELNIELITDCCNRIYNNSITMFGKYGTSLDECLDININKLKKRFPEGFSEEAAIQRADEQLDN